MSVYLFLFSYLSFFCALRAYCMSERALPANVFTECDPGMVAGAGAALCTVTVYCFPLPALFFAFIATSFSTLTAFTLLSSPLCVCAGGAARSFLRSPPGTMRALAGVVAACMCTDGGGGAARWHTCVLVARHNGSAMHSGRSDGAMHAWVVAVPHS